MTAKPSGELVLIFDLDQVHGVLSVDLCQGEGVRGGGGISRVDPIDEGLLVPQDQGCPIEHDRCAGPAGVEYQGSSRGHPMVLVDQPAQDLSSFPFLF